MLRRKGVWPISGLSETSQWSWTDRSTGRRHDGSARSTASGSASAASSMTTSKIGDARCSAIDRRRASSVRMIRAITGHGALNHAIKKGAGPENRNQGGHWGLQLKGPGGSIEAPFTPKIGTRLGRTPTITRTLVYEFSSE